MKTRGAADVAGIAAAARPAVIVPTYNERLNLEALVERLVASAEVDIVIVDDGSPDGTGQLSDRLAADVSRTHVVTVLHRESKSGRGGAVLAGMQWAFERGYGVVVEMDADQSHQPEELPRLLRALDRADLVVGSRYLPGSSIEGWGLHRRLNSRMANTVAKVLLGIPGMSDYTNGYRCYSRRAVETLLNATMQERGYIALSESAMVLNAAGFRISSEPTRFVNRTLGKSNAGIREMVDALRGLARISVRYRRSRRMQASRGN